MVLSYSGLNHIRKNKVEVVFELDFFDINEKQTFGIQFVVQKNRENEKNLTLFARITINSAVSEISLKHNISSKDWNPVTGTGKGRKTELKNSPSEKVDSLIVAENVVEIYILLLTTKFQFQCGTIDSRLVTQKNSLFPIG